MENRELEITVFTSTWFTWLLAPLSSFCNTHTVSLASSLRAWASPGAAERPLPALPGASPPARCPAEPRQSGSEGHVVKKVQLFFFFLIVLFFCR